MFTIEKSMTATWIYCILGTDTPDQARGFHLLCCSYCSSTWNKLLDSAHGHKSITQFRMIDTGPNHVHGSFGSVSEKEPNGRFPKPSSCSQRYLDILTRVELLVPAKIHWFVEERHHIRIEGLPVWIL